MRPVTVIMLISCLICSETLASIGFIDNAEGQDCSSGTCIQVCHFEGTRLLPGTETTNDGKCRRVRCLPDFSVQITHCPSSSSLERCLSEKYNDNSKLPFPMCCDKTCKT